MSYIENNLIDSVGDMSLTVDSLIKTDNTIAASNDITLRKFNVNPYGFDKMYMEKDPIEDMLYQNNRSIQWNENYACKVLFNISKQNTSISWCNGRTRKIIIKFLLMTEN